MVDKWAPQLVEDLVPLILESSDIWWPRDLCRLARISSTWLEPVRRRLYNHPVLYTFETCNNLATALQKNPYLASLIHGLNLRPMNDEYSTSKRSLAKELMGIRHLLSLNGLECITFAGQLSVSAERFLMMISEPNNLERLCFDGTLLQDSLSRTPSIDWGGSFACMFPNLKSLVLRNMELEITPPIPYRLCIKELVLDHVTITCGFLTHILDESGGLGQLSVSTDDSSTYGEQIRSLMHHLQIDSLYYDGDDCGGVTVDEMGFASLNAPPHLAELRGLHLKGFRMDWEALTMIRDRCRELEELAVVGERVQVTPSEWVEFVQHGSGSLRRLEVPVNGRGKVLEKVCKQLGICYVDEH